MNHYDNHRFYDAMPGQAWLVNNTQFGHGDLLDEFYYNAMTAIHFCGTDKWVEVAGLHSLALELQEPGQRVVPRRHRRHHRLLLRGRAGQPVRGAPVYRGQAHSHLNLIELEMKG